MNSSSSVHELTELTESTELTELTESTNGSQNFQGGLWSIHEAVLIRTTSMRAAPRTNESMN